MLTRYFHTCVVTTALKIFDTMASHEFGGVFSLDDKPLQSLPVTVQRKKEKLPRTPTTSTAAPESTETPYTSDDTYNDEPDTPTMTRKP
jgi:hypothetical protein